MATTPNQLAQIAALTDILTPLGGKVRGGRIEADDWNAIVTVLAGILGIDKNQEQVVTAGLEQNFAPKDHQHIGQVTIDWLDPSLKATLADAGSSVSVRSAIAGFQKTIDSLTAQVATLSATVQQQQKQIDAAGTNGLDQSNSLRNFETRFSAVENLRTDVTAITSQIQGLTANVNTVLDLRKSLSDAAGKPIDVAGLQSQVQDLQNLRANLTGVDGTLVRVRDFELRIANVENALQIGGGSGLDGRISTAVLAAEDRLSDKLTLQVNQLGATLQTSNDAANATLRSDLTAQVNASAQANDASIAAAEGRLNANVSSQIAAASTNIQKTVLDAAAAQTTQQLSGIPAQIQSAVASAATALNTSLTQTLTANFTGMLNSATASLTSTFNSQLNAVQTNLTSQIAAVVAAIPIQVSQGVANLRDSLSADFNQQLDQRFSDFRTSVLSTVATSVNTAVTSATSGLSQQIGTEVTNQIGDLNGKINLAVAGATRTLPDLVNTQTQAAIAALNLPAQFSAQAAQLTSQFRGELNQGIANVRAASSTDLNNAVQTLRGEIGSVRARLPNVVLGGGGIA